MPQPVIPQTLPPQIEKTWLKHPAVVALAERFPEITFNPRDTVVRGKPIGMTTVTVGPDRLIEVMTFLKGDRQTQFDMLAELTCVDYLVYPDLMPGRFGVTYGLTSTALGHRLWVKVFVGEEDASVPSVFGLWRGADWPEREVYDMFGVEFAGHPDLRRILTPPGFKYHPLRKDYPVTGMGEREALPVILRMDA